MVRSMLDVASHGDIYGSTLPGLIDAQYLSHGNLCLVHPLGSGMNINAIITRAAHHSLYRVHRKIMHTEYIFKTLLFLSSCGNVSRWILMK